MRCTTRDTASKTTMMMARQIAFLDLELSLNPGNCCSTSSIVCPSMLKFSSSDVLASSSDDVAAHNGRGPLAKAALGKILVATN